MAVNTPNSNDSLPATEKERERESRGGTALLLLVHIAVIDRVIGLSAAAGTIFI